MPVFPFTRLTLHFRANLAKFITMILKKKQYSSTDPFVVKTVMPKFNKNARIAKLVHKLWFVASYMLYSSSIIGFMVILLFLKAPQNNFALKSAYIKLTKI